MSSKTFRPSIVAALAVATIASLLAANPANAMPEDSRPFGLAFAPPDDATPGQIQATGRGTLTVPDSGLGVTLSVEAFVGGLGVDNVFIFFIRNVGSVAGDDTACPDDENAILNNAMEQAYSGWAFTGGTQNLSGETGAETLTATFDPTDRAGDTRLTNGEYAVAIVNANFTIIGCAEMTAFDGDIDTATTVDEIQASENYVPLEHGEILGLYRALFNREPDFDGAMYWISTVYEGGLLVDENGQPLTDAADRLQRIANLFANEDQPEYQRVYGDIETDAEFVTAIYTNVLGRAGDADGIAYWTDQLAQGLSRPEALRWMALGAEFICGRGAYGRPCPLT